MDTLGVWFQPGVAAPGSTTRSSVTLIALAIIGAVWRIVVVKIKNDKEVRVAQIEKDRDVETAQIEKDRDIEVARLETEQARTLAGAEAKSIEAHDQMAAQTLNVHMPVLPPDTVRHVLAGRGSVRVPAQDRESERVEAPP